MIPVIGVTVDTQENASAREKYEVARAYASAVSAAGGLAIYLPHDPDRAEAYIELCDGLMLTGGGDPAMEAFGVETDSRARVIDPTRQAFELALLETAQNRPALPVLGICLGMQLQALLAGGQLDQYLPDTLGEAAEAHQHDNPHPIELHASDSVLSEVLSGASEGEAQAATVVSSHRQAVAKPGRLRVVATAPDGVIEAIDDPTRRFYLGVQWHPERGQSDSPLSFDLIRGFVRAARCAR